MRLETKTLLLLIILVIIMGVTVRVVKHIEIEDNIISPINTDINIFSLFGKHDKPKKIIYGYLPWWNLDQINNLQLDKLTDIAYFGLYLNADGTFRKTRGDGISEPGYSNWVDNQDLKELIDRCDRYGVRFAVTLVSHEDDVSDEFLDCRSCWETLYTNLSSELNKMGVKHVNLNFEYGGATALDKAEKYVEFTDFLNKKLDNEFKDSFVVTSAFGDSNRGDRISSKVEDLARVSDGIFIMGYDFHRPGSDSTGPVAPLDGPGFNITQMLQDFMSVAPPNKLILGVPYYGYNWVVNDGEKYTKVIKDPAQIIYANELEEHDQSKNDDNEEDENVEIEAPHAQSQMYANIMETILNSNPKVLWNEEGKSPYFNYISDDSGAMRQVYFENEQSLREKYDLVNDIKLAGVGIWALGYDGGYTELWNLLYEEFIQ